MSVVERLVEDRWKERAKVRERKRDRGIEGETASDEDTEKCLSWRCVYVYREP